MEDQKQKNEGNNTFFCELNDDFLKYELLINYLNFMFPELVLICFSFDRLKKQIEYRDCPENNICFLDSLLEKCINDMKYINEDQIVFQNEQLIDENKPNMLWRITDLVMRSPFSFPFPFTNDGLALSALARIRCPFYILCGLLFFLKRASFDTLSLADMNKINNKINNETIHKKGLYLKINHDRLESIMTAAILLRDIELIQILSKYFIGWMKNNQSFVECCLKAEDIIKVNPNINGIVVAQDSPQFIFQWVVKNFKINQNYANVIRKDHISFYKCIFEEKKNDLSDDEESKEDLFLALHFDSVEIFKYLVIEKGYKVGKRHLTGKNCKIYLEQQENYKKYLIESLLDSSEDEILEKAPTKPYGWMSDSESDDGELR